MVELSCRQRNMCGDLAQPYAAFIILMQLSSDVQSFKSRCT